MARRGHDAHGDQADWRQVMTKYRKKPVVIEAFHMTSRHMASNSEWPDWLRSASTKLSRESGAVWFEHGSMFIRTMEGRHVVSLDDWIIRGVKGELYPCKPDIFEMTYEPAEGE